jgi:hypothetical protein
MIPTYFQVLVTSNIYKVVEDMCNELTPNLESTRHDAMAVSP